MEYQVEKIEAYVRRAIKTDWEPMSSQICLFNNQKIVWTRMINFRMVHINKMLDNDAEWLAATNI